MKPNVFLKTIIRQPIRSLILLLLVSAAAFAFTLRAVEFVVVQAEMARLEGHFRSIGFFTSNDPDNLFHQLGFTDYSWQNIITDSPYVEFVDIRRLDTGELEGMNNADYGRGMFMHVPESHTYLVRDTYFFGTLLDSRLIEDAMSGDAFWNPGHHRPLTARTNWHTFLTYRIIRGLPWPEDDLFVAARFM